MSDLINDTEKHPNELKQDDKYFVSKWSHHRHMDCFKLGNTLAQAKQNMVAPL
jgi:hypothetical protein